MITYTEDDKVLAIGHVLYTPSAKEYIGLGIYKPGHDITKDKRPFHLFVPSEQLRRSEDLNTKHRRFTEKTVLVEVGTGSDEYSMLRDVLVGNRPGTVPDIDWEKVSTLEELRALLIWKTLSAGGIHLTDEEAMRAQAEEFELIKGGMDPVDALERVVEKLRQGKAP